MQTGTTAGTGRIEGYAGAVGAGAGLLSLFTVYLLMLIEDGLTLALLAGGAAGLAVLAWAGIRYRSWVRDHAVKLFIVLFVLGLNTPAVLGYSHLELTDGIIMSGVIALFVLAFVRGREIHMTGLDFANACFLVALFLPVTKSIINILIVILFVKSLLISFVITNVCVRRENLVFLVKTYLVFAVISALAGIAQEIAYLATGIPVTGFIESKALSLMFEDTSLGTMMRVPAFTDSYKTLCFILLLAASISLSYLLFSSISRRRKALLLGALVIIGAGVVLTFSKDGLLTCGIVFGAALFVKYRRFAIHFAVVLLIVAALLLIYDSHFSLVGSVYDELHFGEYRVRLHLDKEGMAGFLYKKPWIGAGLEPHKYTGHYFKWAAHNNFILAADEAGIFGLLGLMGVIGYTLYRAITLNLLRLSEHDRPIAIGMLMGILAYVMLLQFHSGFIVSYLWMLMGMIQGMYLANRPPGRDPVPEGAGVPAPADPAR